MATQIVLFARVSTTTAAEMKCLVWGSQGGRESEEWGRACVDVDPVRGPKSAKQWARHDRNGRQPISLELSTPESRDGKSTRMTTTTTRQDDAAAKLSSQRTLRFSNYVCIAAFLYLPRLLMTISIQFLCWRFILIAEMLKDFLNILIL
jgi:hypothetical protein